MSGAAWTASAGHQFIFLAFAFSLVIPSNPAHTILHSPDPHPPQSHQWRPQPNRPARNERQQATRPLVLHPPHQKANRHFTTIGALKEILYLFRAMGQGFWSRAICSLKAHSSVFRNMLSSNDLLPSYSSSPSGRARLDLSGDIENAATVKTVLSILHDGLMLPALVDDLKLRSIPVLDNVLHFAKKWDMPFLSNHVEGILSKALQHPDDLSRQFAEERLSPGDIFILAARSALPHLARLAVARMSYWFDGSGRPGEDDTPPIYTHWWDPVDRLGAAFPCMMKPRAFAMIPNKYIWALLASGNLTIDKSERGDEFLLSINCYDYWCLHDL